MRLATALIPALVLVSACAINGERPGDVTVAQHDAMARAENRAAAADDARYDPGAREVREFCNSSNASTDVDVCWTSVRNPTAVHLARAEEHRKRAAQHRAASQALRDAEARACAGVSELDRSISPFEHREEISRVDLVDTNVPERRTRGVRVVFRAVPGLSAERMQRLVDCHTARNAALGHDMPDMPFCPLVLRGVEAQVVRAGSDLGVEVTSSDPSVVHEIIRRGLALLSR